MPRLQLVIFDIAGTLVKDEGYVAEVYRGLLGERGIEPEAADLARVMGWSKPRALRFLLEAGGKEPTDEEVAALAEEFEQRMTAFFRDDARVAEIPGATEVLRWLGDHGIRRALDTGFSRPVCDAIMRRVGWGMGLIDASVASNEVPRGRPHADMAIHLMERLSVSPTATAHVGDTPSDLGSGHQAGLALNIGVTQGAQPAQQLLQHPHTHLITSIKELPQLLIREQWVM